MIYKVYKQLSPMPVYPEMRESDDPHRAVLLNMLCYVEGDTPEQAMIEAKQYTTAPILESLQ